MWHVSSHSGVATLRTAIHLLLTYLLLSSVTYTVSTVIIIIIIIKGIYIAQVRKGHKCAMSAEMAVWLRNCLYLYNYLSHN